MIHSILIIGQSNMAGRGFPCEVDSERYYREFLKLEDKNKLFVEKSSADAAIRTGLEHL